MTWLDQPLVALDTESTGVDPQTARVLSVCIGDSSEPGCWDARTWWCAPDVAIPAEATAVHGLTAEIVTERAGGASRADQLAAVRRQLHLIAARNIPIVAHNARYDFTLLDAEMRRTLDVGLPDGLIVLDTLVLFRRLWTQTGSRTLGKLAERHGIIFPAHDAEADALACLRLLHILAGQHDLLEHVPARALHHLQSAWWADAQDADAAKAAGNGTPRTPGTGWPVATSPERTTS